MPPPSEAPPDPTDAHVAAGPERLQRTLARAGYGSRRGAEDLIRQGRVRVGRRVATLGDRVDPARDRITVDGVPVATHPELRYFAFNKPAGVTTTLRDRHASRTVQEYLPTGPPVVPVGRLDRDSEGLLLLTNDGTLGHRLQHPRYGVEKEYLVEVKGDARQAALRRLEDGILLADGPARARRTAVVQRGGGRSAVSIVMLEGRKREVRRMFEAIGHPVTRLVRVRLGPIRLGRLSPGRVRSLARTEVDALYRLTGLDRAVPTRSRDAASRRPKATSR
jgi:23S rRNA pseudouridine2605 synthase